MAKDLIKVDGLRELDEALSKVSIKMQKSFVTSGLRAGAKPIISKAKEGAMNSKHPSSGALAESIGFKAKRKGGQSVSAWVGSLRSNKKALTTYVNFYGGTVSTISDGIRHGHLIELGANGVGKRPFLRPALDGQTSLVISEFKKKVKARLDSEAKKIHNAQKNKGRK